MHPSIAVIGAGTMGRGIAQVAATTGHRTTLFDVEHAILDEARQSIEKSVAKGIEKKKMSPEAATALNENLTVHTELGAAVEGADFVIEAVPEKIDLKVRIFAEVARHVGPDCILASNTSSLSVGAMAAQLPEPGRVIGMHFFNPVPIMKLLEIVVPEATSERVKSATLDLSRALGKEPIVVKDSPGFATSRLGLVIGLEAIRMLEAEVASAEDIDRAMELGYRHPMGPLRLTDFVGLDVRLAIAEHLHKEIGPQFEPPALLREKVATGHLGRKVGRGFYEYP